MKEIIWVVLIAFVGNFTTAQYPLLKSSTSDSIIQLTNQSKPIVSDVLKFNYYIHQMYYDGEKEYLTLHLREQKNNKNYFKNKGYLFNIDLKDKKSRWSQEVKFYNSFVDYKNEVIFVQKPLKTEIINLGNGKIRASPKIDIVYISPREGCVIGYNTKSKDRNKLLQSYDTRSGILLWEDNVDRTYGWREVRQLDSTSIMVVASGITSIDLRKGVKWKQIEKSGKTKINLLTNVNIFYNHNSNVIIDSTSIYSASAESITKSDIDGNQIWEVDLNKDQTGTSILIQRPNDSLIYLINTGFINTTNNPFKKYGTPYITAANKYSGKNIYTKYFTYLDKIEFIGNQDKILLYDGKNVLSIEPRNGEVVSEYKFDKNDDEYVGFMKDSLYYIQKDQVFKINEYYSLALWMLTKKGGVNGIDKLGNVKAQINSQQLTTKIGRLNQDYDLFTTIQNQTLVIDKNNQIVARLSGIFQFTNDKFLFLKKDEQLNIVNLNNLLDQLQPLDIRP